LDSIILVSLATGIISVLLNVFLKRYDVPPIIGYIITGAIIGSIVMPSDTKVETLEHIAEFGIVFLMFTIGLEIKLENLIQMKKQVFTYGSLQVLIVMAVFSVIAYYMYEQNIKEALVIGSALSLSSTAIVLKILNDTNHISKEYGQNTLGILIFQDLAVIPILLMLTVFTDNTSTISSMLFDIVGAGFILILILIIFGKYFLDYILKIITKSDTHELFIMVVLIIAIGSSYLAHFLGFTYSLGAFIGGMLIAETHYKHQVEADLVPFRDIFLALFFVSVGIAIDMEFLIDHILEVFGISFFIMIVKALIIFGLLRIFTNKKVALETSLAISQVGEFSFVIFTQAMGDNLLDKEAGQLLTLSVIVSMILTPFILKKIDYFRELFYKKDKVKVENPIIIKDRLEGHIVICSSSEFGNKVAKNVDKLGAKYIIVSDRLEYFERIKKHHNNIIFGNPTQKNILQEAGIKRAKVALITIEDINSITILYYAIKAINPDIKIIAKVTNLLAFDANIDTSYFVNINEFAADILATDACDYLI
jgi:CPA2 family monovalent cation:H+ antiporter-2